MMCHHKYILSSFFFICNILAILKDEKELLILNPSEVCKYVHYTLMYELYVSTYICMYICMYIFTHVSMYMYACTHAYMYERMYL